MKKNQIYPLMVICIVLFFTTIGCNTPKSDTANKTVETTQQTTAEKPDVGAIKAEIQAIENTWATAVNAKDAAIISNFYADDAVSFINNKPMLTGKAAIQKEIDQQLANHKDIRIVTYETLDVHGDNTVVTETGKTTAKDTKGTVTYAGKYMAIWEKRNGKWLVVRDMYNDDAKEK